MIWTVILKSGEGFVVYGSKPNISEVTKAIKARGLKRNQVAGVVRGSHEVVPCPKHNSKAENYYDAMTRISNARKSAMSAPIIRDKSDREAFPEYPDYEQSFMLEERTYPEPQNDPRDW